MILLSSLKESISGILMKISILLLLENTQNKPPNINLLLFTNRNILSTNKYMGQKKNLELSFLKPHITLRSVRLGGKLTSL